MSISNIKFDELKHEYKVKGKKVPSVSQVIKYLDKSGVLMKWEENLTRGFLESHKNQMLTRVLIDNAVTQYRQKSEEALSMGKKVHKFAEDYTKWAVLKVKKEPIPDTLIEKPCTAFINWFKDKMVIQTEYRVSSKYGFAGTFDAIININGTKHIIDYKTSKAFYKTEMSLQLAAYKYAYIDETGENLGNSMIIRFDKETGEFEVYEIENEDVYFEAFIAILRIMKL